MFACYDCLLGIKSIPWRYHKCPFECITNKTIISTYLRYPLGTFGDYSTTLDITCCQEFIDFAVTGSRIILGKLTAMLFIGSYAHYRKRNVILRPNYIAGGTLMTSKKRLSNESNVSVRENTTKWTDRRFLRRIILTLFILAVMIGLPFTIIRTFDQGMTWIKLEGHFSGNTIQEMAFFGTWDEKIAWLCIYLGRD